MQPQGPFAPGDGTPAQAAWDRYLLAVLQTLADPNPLRRGDLALDRTIRALGPRPAREPDAAEHAALVLRGEIERHLLEAMRPRKTGQKRAAERWRGRKFAAEDAFEDWCGRAQTA